MSNLQCRESILNLSQTLLMGVNLFYEKCKEFLCFLKSSLYNFIDFNFNYPLLVNKNVMSTYNLNLNQRSFMIPWRVRLLATDSWLVLCDCLSLKGHLLPQTRCLRFEVHSDQILLVLFCEDGLPTEEIQLQFKMIQWARRETHNCLNWYWSEARTAVLA